MQVRAAICRRVQVRAAICRLLQVCAAICHPMQIRAASCRLKTNVLCLAQLVFTLVPLAHGKKTHLVCMSVVSFVFAPYVVQLVPLLTLIYVQCMSAAWCFSPCLHQCTCAILCAACSAVCAAACLSTCEATQKFEVSGPETRQHPRFADAEHIGFGL